MDVREYFLSGPFYDRLTRIQAKNALDHLNGFHLQERYIVVLYHMPAKQDAAAAKADLAAREEELARLKKQHDISDDWSAWSFRLVVMHSQLMTAVVLNHTFKVPCMCITASPHYMCGLADQCRPERSCKKLQLQMIGTAIGISGILLYFVRVYLQ